MRTSAGRRSSGSVDLSIEDLIPEEDVVVTLSHGGYAKSQPIEATRRSVAAAAAGRRPSEGRGLHRQAVRREYARHLLCFSSRGKVYWLKVYQVPQAGRDRAADRSSTYCRWRKESGSTPCSRSGSSRKQVRVHGYQQGTVKKTPLAQFARPRKRHHRDRLARRRSARECRNHGRPTGHMLFASSGKGDTIP